MKENTDYDQYMIWRHLRHCVVIFNAILGLVMLHYMAYLAYGLWKFIF